MRWILVMVLCAALRSATGLADGSTEVAPVFVRAWGSLGSGPGQFEFPGAMAVDASGRVFVVDGGNTRIQVFTAEGQLLDVWGRFGEGPGLLWLPIAVAVAEKGNITADVFVLDWYRGDVQVFTTGGKFLRRWDGSQGAGTFKHPSGMALDDSGNVYVADGFARIQKFTSAGTFLKSWNVSVGPFALAVDGNRFLYTTGLLEPSITKFTTQGDLVAIWPGDSELPSPGWLATDIDGNVYATTSEGLGLFKLSPDGKKLAHWGPSGDQECNSSYPGGIAVSRDGRIYVSCEALLAHHPPACIQEFASAPTPVTHRSWGALKIRYR